MAFNIDALMDGSLFSNTPHNRLDQLFHQCHDDTLIIPRYLDENPSYPFYHDHYEMHWTEEDCEKIHDAFENLYNDLHSIAESGSVNEDIDDEQVKRAVMQADSNPDHFVNVYARRLCRLIRYKAPRVIVNNEAVSLAISMAVNRYSTAYHREDCDELTEKALRYEYEYQMLASAAGYIMTWQENQDFENVKEMVKKVDHALSLLTEEEREVLRNRYFEWTTLEESAERFDCSAEKLRKIEAVAIRKMREHLKLNDSPKPVHRSTYWLEVISMNEYQSYWANELKNIDNVFIEMFGSRNAISVYHRMGKYFEKCVKDKPELYINNDNALENKRNLVANLICQKYDFEDSIWYE